MTVLWCHSMILCYKRTHVPNCKMYNDWKRFLCAGIIDIIKLASWIIHLSNIITSADLTYEKPKKYIVFYNYVLEYHANKFNSCTKCLTLFERLLYSNRKLPHNNHQEGPISKIVAVVRSRHLEKFITRHKNSAQFKLLEVYVCYTVYLFLENGWFKQWKMQVRKKTKGLDT